MEPICFEYVFVHRVNFLINDFLLLGSNFDFVMDYDDNYILNKDILDFPVNELPSECVWKVHGSAPRSASQFVNKVNNIEACRDRVHIDSTQGLVHPFRSDTRRFGVGPLAFWSAMKPANYLMEAADKFIARMRKHNQRLVGIHSRSHNSYDEPIPKVGLFLFKVSFKSV